MNRRQKLRLNTAMSLLAQVVSIICGFVLPRYILLYFGSDVNGLVSSVSQLLGLISLCELGVGAVVQSSLYRPLAEGDMLSTSKIMISARRFFDKVGIILGVYVLVLAGTFPFAKLEQFDFLSTALLIGAMSISSFAQYFFGAKEQILLKADQKSYICLAFQILTVVLNTVVSILIIKAGASIQLVKLSASLIFLIRPIGLVIYVKRHYKLDYSLKLTEEPIKQKWNGLAQHFAAVVLGSTDTVVLTFFSTLGNVSIYNVYYLVTNGVKSLVVSLTCGLESYIGNMLAKNENEKIQKAFALSEWIIHTLVTLVFTMTGLLILPFVGIYTSGVADADYYQPIFAIMLTAATASYCIRLPYSVIVLAAGHYKQTQWSAIIEMAINIVLSIILVFPFGLVGVAIGTLAAMAYRTVYYALYLRKNIINRGIGHFIKHILVDLLSVGCMVAACFWIKIGGQDYLSWLLMALEIGLLCLALSLIINIIFYHNHVKETLKGMMTIFRKRGGVLAKNKTPGGGGCVYAY